MSSPTVHRWWEERGLVTHPHMQRLRKCPRLPQRWPRQLNRIQKVGSLCFTLNWRFRPTFAVTVTIATMCCLSGDRTSCTLLSLSVSRPHIQFCYFHFLFH